MSDTILLVEDNEDDVFLMRRALRRAGMSYPMLVATDGQEAIDYLSGKGKFGDRTTYPVPALIFLDLKLPLVGGLEVLSWIKEDSSDPLIPLAVLTSSEEPSDIREANRLGANLFLVKPLKADQLQKVLSEILISR